MYNVFMSAAVLMYMYGGFNPFASIASYFKSKDALDSEKAIEMKTIDWITLGLQHLPPEKISKAYPFIKSTLQNKYWLDVIELETYIQRRQKLGTRILVISAIVMIFVILFFLFRP